MSDIESRDHSVQVVSRELATAGYENTSVFFFEELHSTSQWLGQRAPDTEAHLPELCATHWQTAGIARRGRTWQTAPGNITFSLKTYTDKPIHALLGLSLVTGIGVARCLEETIGLPIKLKWPNDVIADNRKLSGLLTEVRAGDVNTIITGIGINVLANREVSTLGIGACSIEELIERPVARDELLGKVAVSVLQAHEQFLRDGWSVFAEEWATRDWLLDRPVHVIREGETEHAIARGVDESGAMIIEQAGRRVSVVSGEVSIRPDDDQQS